MILLNQPPPSGVPAVPTEAVPDPSPIIITPPDVIINTPMPDLPGWAIPLIAGVFTILGVAISWFGNKSLQAQKNAADQKREINRTAREWADTVLKETGKIAAWALKQETRTYKKPMREAIREIPGLVQNLSEAIGDPEMHAPASVADAGKALIAHAYIMVMPIWHEEVNAENRLEYYSKRQALVNAVRDLDGLPAIANKVTEIQPYSEHKKTIMEQTGFMESLIYKYEEEVAEQEVIRKQQTEKENAEGESDSK
ncbi:MULTISPECIES: hypothetical protein [unclassified Rhodococcus (in: high G+C Gram-positive bacteria)]|uniref:hypothetical protein n=1 Tax=unclassified Rhodococcus (in: high G+C Gram-positive bacteria) TaxID=192944 RepID=UPI00117B22F3|nr:MULTISPECIES: hypothetical protein [unclassified Rhodococcus (in: high G+C Gram-positive bacteria)]